MGDGEEPREAQADQAISDATYRAIVDWALEHMQLPSIGDVLARVEDLERRVDTGALWADWVATKCEQALEERHERDILRVILVEARSRAEREPTATPAVGDEG